MTLTAVPLGATAVEPTTNSVTIEVTIADQDAPAPLVGAVVTLRNETSGADVGASTTGLDGRVTFDVDTTASSQYSAAAEWPGGDALWWLRTEFIAKTTSVVAMNVQHPYRYLTGHITATDGVTLLPDLTGGAAVLSRGDSILQTIPLAADGSFNTPAVPTIDAEQYRLSFTPPPAYVLVDGQDAVNAAFELPTDLDGATTLDVSRQFSVLPLATPKPTPTATPTETPAPAPVQAPGAIVLPGATGLSEGLNAMSEAQLEDLLSATAQTRSGNTVPITNEQGQVLGLAFGVQDSIQQKVQTLIGSIISNMAGVAVKNVPLVAFDTEEALQRATLTNKVQMLDDQVMAKVEDIKAGNALMSRIKVALDAVGTYSDGPNTPSFVEASTSVREAGVASDPFLDASATTAIAVAPMLSTKLTGLLYSAENYQSLEMDRLHWLIARQQVAVRALNTFLAMMAYSESRIIGTMRSEPVDVGTVQWANGQVTGSFDLSAVPDGSHHLILNFADLGVTIVADVEVQRGTPAVMDVQRGTLAVTGAQTGATPAIGLGLLLLGLAVVLGGPFLRRRESRA
ncbi:MULTISPECIES: hypothetical protein [Cryobacterium]|uniref:Carboxypeptidase regulatory-like domain-containing protein n=1 Tax=Cryobacterium breve TaxID=1259258 RepID=A0ABY2JAK0_9MICO|nr:MULTISPECIES: hypothetical protein [Cryobacterium]TFC94501.1 hypothetical protein E3T20_08365 [Cryobacterium sp. TmT3-12]TFD01977.1 hypothetical protein E3O65_00285 [Cryobacterium breve]